MRCDRARRAIELGKVDVAIGEARRADGEEHGSGIGHALARRRREGELARRDPVAQQLIESWLVDRYLAAAKPFNPLLQCVAADDLMAQLHETGTCCEPDIPGTDDGYAHLDLPYRRALTTTFG